jgi:DNA-binding CsgD family transcriptional regulator
MRRATSHLTRADHAVALGLLALLEREAHDLETFSRACVAGVGHYLGASVVLRPMPGPATAELHRLEMPLTVDATDGAAIVLTRRSPPFTTRDRERLALLQPHLAFLHGQAARNAKSPPRILTQRESEVMRWLSFGKTDTDIASMLSISPRTVHKHLEHIYVKLGVETRTAAVMRGRSFY